MKYITLAIAILIGISAEAQVIRAEPFYTAPEEAVSGNLLLDDYPGAAVAYSLRKLDKDYTGSAIRVRRSNDNAEQDIGFVNNYLDTASMKTFVGVSNGFVVTWYNQADSAGFFGVRNVTQGTAANQPRIIANGALNYKGGEIALLFDGSNDFFQSPPISAFNTDLHSSFCIINTDDTLQVGIIYRHSFASGTTNSTSNSTFFGALISSTTLWTVQSRTSTGTAINSTNASTKNPSLLSWFWKADDTVTGYLNSNIFNVTGSGANAVPGGHNFFRIGESSGSTGNAFEGNMMEIIMYASDNSSNRTAIETNINSFYSIY